MKIFNQVAIIGVGLIGGSLGKALKEKKLASKVVGIVRRKKSIAEALQNQAVDIATLDLQEGVKDADLIVIGVPAEDILPTIDKITPYIKKDTIITDVGSVKEKIVIESEKKLEKKAFFIGSHPIAGSERKGVTHALGSLFLKAVCVITPTKKSNKQALNKIISLWKNIGSVVKILPPKKHDQIMALVSHLPHLVSVSLVNTVLSKKKKRISEYLGSGFKDTTRIASSPEKIWLDICKANRKELLSALELYKKEIDKISNSLRHKKWQRFTAFLKNAKYLRNKIIK